VSNFGLSQLKEAVSLSDQPIVANQIYYNLLERSAASQELLSYCVENRITVVAYRPLERHVLADQAKDERLVEMADRLGRPAAQIAINWLIGQPGVLTIPKAVSHSHIEENLGALDFELSSSDREILTQMGQ
jgi:diketogulonate reductase-like aldo/keto reductase